MRELGMIAAGFSLRGASSAQIRFCIFSQSARKISSSALAEASVAAEEDRLNALYGAGWDSGASQVKVGVWWDFENCNVPFGVDAHKVGMNIVSGLRSSGFKGPVSISGYGDMLQLSRNVQESLSATGIRLHHVPSGGKESESSDRALLMDLMLWTMDNPPPAHLFLISGDRDFSTALHKLRMRNYNVLLACPAGAIISPALLGAATRVWYWNSLVRGEALVAASSWSNDGPSPKPIFPPLKSPSSGNQDGSSSKLEHEYQKQEKVPYFTSSQPLSCPPVPPPFSNPSSSAAAAAAAPEYLSPYSVSSPHFPSVSNLQPPSEKSQMSSSSTKASEKSQMSSSFSKAEQLVIAAQIPPPRPVEVASPKGNGKSGKPVLQNRNASAKTSSSAAVPEKSAKTETISEVLGRLDTLLKTYPNGLWMAELQSLMSLRKIQFDSDFFGHKKLVPYLLTLPRIARVERHLMKDNRTWSYMFFSSTAPASDFKSSKRAGYPMEVLHQLSNLFRHYPKGIWLGEFNAQLVTRNIRLDSNFYGHVKIVPFLLSLPEMVKIERRYTSDRWNYVFLWNQAELRKTELATSVEEKPSKTVKRLVVATAASPYIRTTTTPAEVVETKQERPSEELKGSELRRDEISDEVIHETASAKTTKKFTENALVRVEEEEQERAVSFSSRIAAASGSFVGIFRKMCRRLWPQKQKEVKPTLQVLGSTLSAADIEEKSQKNVDSASEALPTVVNSDSKSVSEELSLGKTPTVSAEFEPEASVLPAESVLGEYNVAEVEETSIAHLQPASIADAVLEERPAALKSSSLHFSRSEVLEVDAEQVLEPDLEGQTSLENSSAEVSVAEQQPSCENNPEVAEEEPVIISAGTLQSETSTSRAGVFSEERLNREQNVTGELPFADAFLRQEVQDDQQTELMDEAKEQTVKGVKPECELEDFNPELARLLLETTAGNKPERNTAEGSIDADRVLELFECFREETASACDNVSGQTSDVSSQVLDLLSKSIPLNTTNQIVHEIIKPKQEPEELKCNTKRSCKRSAKATQSNTRSRTKSNDSLVQTEVRKSVDVEPVTTARSDRVSKKKISAVKDASDTLAANKDDASATNRPR